MILIIKVYNFLPLTLQGQCICLCIFSCVQHHLCTDGEIVTDGGDFFVFKSGFSNRPDPLLSKCPGVGEVCCRREEFKGIPVGGSVTVTKPSPKCTECENAG